jgi:membrane protein
VLVEQARSGVAAVRGSGPGRFFAKYQRDRADDHAALIAYSGLFSIVPMIGGLLTLLGLVTRDPDIYAQVAGLLIGWFPAELSGLLRGLLAETQAVAGWLGITSFIGLLWGATFIWGRMARAFNTFYQLEGRGLVRQTMASIVMVVVTGLVFIVATGAAVAALFLLELPAYLVIRAVVWGAVCILLLITYRVVPNGPVKVSGVWPGAVLAMILFDLVNELWPVVMGLFGGGVGVYQTLALVLLLMTWLNVSARILVLGCELNAFLHPVQTSGCKASEAAPVAGK